VPGRREGVRVLKRYARRSTGGGISDSFQRPISYLRISVTDRCNLRFVYCMPRRHRADPSL